MTSPRVPIPEEKMGNSPAHPFRTSVSRSKTRLSGPGNDEGSSSTTRRFHGASRKSEESSRHRGESDFEMGNYPLNSQRRNESSNERGRPISTTSSTPVHRSPTPEPSDTDPKTLGASPTTLRRGLQAQHIYMIALSAAIGAGYYVRTGMILKLGGPGAVLYPYAIVGTLALMVLHGLSRMLRVWPVAGALISFVRAFVDEEMAVVVGLFYWLTYCLSFVGLAITVGDLVEVYHISKAGSVCVTVASLIFPILVNLMDIRVFRKVELFMGGLKIAVALTVILVMNIINPTVAHENAVKQQKDGTFEGNGRLFHEDNVKGGWFGALAISTLIVTFAYVGVEVVAATAQEATLEDVALPEDSQAQEGNFSRESSISDPFHLPAILVPVTAMFIYLWGGWLATQNVNWNNEGLPDWIKANNGASVFVLSATQYSKSLGKGLTALLIINVLSTSSTALFVASRTLFGLTRDLGTRAKSNKLEKWFARFGRKSKYDNPWRAVLASSWLVWVPFLRYSDPKTFEIVLNIVIEISSVNCVFVWACESVAAFRLYRCYKRHKLVLDRQLTAFGILAPIYLPVHRNLWYYVHLCIAGAAACGCGLIVVLGGAFASAQSLLGLAVFGIFFILILVFPVLKLQKYGPKFWEWSFGTRLSRSEHVIEIIRRLESGRGTYSTPGEPERIGWRNLGGAIDTDWFRERPERVMGWIRSKYR